VVKKLLEYFRGFGVIGIELVECTVDGRGGYLESHATDILRQRMRCDGKGEPKENKRKLEKMFSRQLNVVYKVTKGLKTLDAATVNEAKTQCKKKVDVSLVFYSENIFVKY
jgi:hypothetical protein